jgi:GLPGLI family protein
MIKFLFPFIFLFIFQNQLLAQNIRFIYNYKSIRDTTDRSSVTDEVVILEINKMNGNSIFSSYKKIKSDSIMTDNANKGFSGFPDGTIVTDYVVEKINKNVFYYTTNHTFSPVQKIQDKRIFKWKLTNEKQEILSYKVQKATLTFGGRKWIAWFAKEIPFSDGPYKFNGLPGLILKISDEKGDHSFEIIGIEKTGSSTYKILKDDNSYFSYKSAISISNENYKKEYLDDRSDPMREIRQKIFMGQMLFNSVKEKNDYIKNTESKLKNEVDRNNNPLEIDLLKK